MVSGELAFGPFRLDLLQRRLFKGEAAVELKSRAMDILCVLASAHGELVTKDALMAQVWPGLVVEENNIAVHISALRKALDEGVVGPSYLLTVPGRGYRLVGVKPRFSSVSDAAIPRELAGPDRPSIAVLPFRNLSSDPEQEYFLDGMVEDIIAGLSRVKWLSVIARESSFIFKGTPINVTQAGNDLGARYILEGGVRKLGNRVRINVKLVEAQSGTHLWADRYDRLLNDVFAVQDEIAMSVIGAIEPGLRKSEVERVKRKRPDSMDAYDLVLRALPFIYKVMPRGCAPAIPLLEKALTLDPDYSFAHAALAWCFHIRFSRGGLSDEDRRTSIGHAHAAVSSATDDATTLAIAAFVIWFDEHDITAAFELFDRALALSSSNVFALCMSAVALAWTGKTEPAIERAQRALKLSPFDSLNCFSYQALAGAHFQAKRYDDAYTSARRAVESNPNFSVPYVYLAATLVRLERAEEAKRAAHQVLLLDPGFTIQRFSVTAGVTPEVFRQFAEAWREAGLPE